MFALMLAGCRPAVTITAPPANAVFFLGQPVDFAGSADDLLHGQLTGDALVWTSDRDGRIGTGAALTVSDLSEGAHTITLTATDSQGLAGTAQVSITVTDQVSFVLTSPAFSEGATLPVHYSCDGADVSPPLNWSGAPDATQSFVLIFDDPDAPRGTFTHWLVFNIPATMPGFAEAFPEKSQTASIREGQNDFGATGYGGACPPAGPAHRYNFRLYALDVAALEAPEGAERDEIEMLMQGHVLAQAELRVTFR
jgi:Raf kinase inhibitor-like YbhB/YbcL family protein